MPCPSSFALQPNGGLQHSTQPLSVVPPFLPVAHLPLPPNTGFQLTQPDAGSGQYSNNTWMPAGRVVSPGAPANSDRMVLPTEFNRIQRLIGRQFTWDAACNDSGDNALCRSFSCPARSFLDTDVSGHTVWINPPYTMIKQFIQHYKSCKLRNPTATSACFVLPKWTGDWVAELAGMQLIKEYPIHSVLFSAPAGDGSRRQLPGIPWPVQVWYDPPATKLVPELMPTSTLTHVYRASAAGFACKVLMDTGASHIFAHQDFVNKVGVRVLPSALSQVSLANGSTGTILGQCTLRLKLGGIIMRVNCLVLPSLPQGVDLILGDAWQKTHRAVLHSAEGKCEFWCCMQKLTIHTVFPPTTEAQETINYAMRTLAAPLTPTATLITPKQLKKALLRGEQAYLVWVKPEWVPRGSAPARKPPSRLPSAPSTFMCAPKATQLGSAVVADASGSLLSEQALADLRAEFKDVFDPPTKPGPDLGIGHTIPLPLGHKPPFTRAYRMSPYEKDQLKKHIADLLEKGYIRPSSSPYGSPVLIVPKPNNPNETRLVVNYSKVNAMCQRLRFPLPRTEDIYDRMAGKKVFTSLDLVSGFFQIRIQPEDIPKTAFTTPDGHYEFLVLPQGLSNSPATFQSVMSKIFAPYLNKFVFCFLDDVTIASSSVEEHVQHLRLVLQVLRDNGFHVRPDKAQWARSEIKFLGHIVGANGVRMDPSKIKAVSSWPPPRNASELRSFLGLSNYFRSGLQLHGCQNE